MGRWQDFGGVPGFLKAKCVLCAGKPGLPRKVKFVKIKRLYFWYLKIIKSLMRGTPVLPVRQAQQSVTEVYF